MRAFISQPTPVSSYHFHFPHVWLDTCHSPTSCMPHYGNHWAAVTSPRTRTSASFPSLFYSFFHNSYFFLFLHYFLHYHIHLKKSHIKNEWFKHITDKINFDISYQSKNYNVKTNFLVQQQEVKYFVPFC